MEKIYINKIFNLKEIREKGENAKFNVKIVSVIRWLHLTACPSIIFKDLNDMIVSRRNLLKLSKKKQQFLLLSLQNLMYTAAIFWLDS